MGACKFLESRRRPVAMRGVIVLCLGLIAVYWVDQHYCGGLYSRETGNMLHQIAANFRR